MDPRQGNYEPNEINDNDHRDIFESMTINNQK